MPVTRTERCIASKLPGVEATDAVAIFVSTSDGRTVDKAAIGGLLRSGTPNGEMKMLDSDYPVVACVEVRIGDKPLGQSWTIAVHEIDRADGPFLGVA